jgi:hypothetical protein
MIGCLKFQACLEAGLPSESDLPNEMAIDACANELSTTISKALAESTPRVARVMPHALRYRLGIQDEIRLKNLFRRKWQISWEPALKAEFSRLQKSLTNQLNEWRNDQLSSMLEILDPEDQSLWKMTKLTNPTEIQHAIQGLKVGKAPGPNGIPNKSLKQLPLSTVSLLVVFNAIFRT